MILLELLAALLAALLAFLLVLAPRLGPRSWLLSLHFAPLALSAAALAAGGSWSGWSVDASRRAAFSLLVLALPALLFFSFLFPNRSGRAAVRWWWPVLVLLAAAAPVLVVRQHLWAATLAGGMHMPVGHLGAQATPLGLYLLAGSVLALANLERVLRSAGEPLRWSIKFLVVGLGASLAAQIAIASQTMLHRRIPESLGALPVVSILASILVLASWKRGTRERGIVVSQSLAYSSLTFLFVGLYLLGSSLAARWAATLLRTPVETELLVVIAAGAVLAVVLLSTAARHRFRRWLRRHLFAGTYDYRALWMEASERIRASDPLERMGGALADLVHKTLDAVEVTVWARDGSDRLEPVAARGLAAKPESSTGEELVRELERSGAEAGVKELSPEESSAMSLLAGRTRAALVVSLRSGNQTVGLLTVGPDRTGSGCGREARECLKVLAGYAAGEMHKRELLAAQVKAKEDEAFRVFSSFLLHDLKNFAATLSLVAKNAVKHEGNPDFRRDAFRSVLETAEKMKRLCNSLRSFSSCLAQNRRPEDLNSLVREVVDRLDPESASRIELDLEELPLVEVDPQEMAAVVQNLLLNALEALAAERDGIRVRTRAAAGRVHLEVEDDGCGIPPSFLENELFLPFHTTKSSGLGIGLFQCRKIVEIHGGRIAVESSEGRGTRVGVHLPAACGEGVPAPPRGPSS